VLRCFRIKCRGDFRGLGFHRRGVWVTVAISRLPSSCAEFSFPLSTSSVFLLTQGEIIPSSVLMPWAFSKGRLFRRVSCSGRFRLRPRRLYDSKLRRVVLRAIISSSWAFFPPRNSGVSKVQLLSSLPLRRGGGGSFRLFVLLRWASF
jgi:hypothetical protein